MDKAVGYLIVIALAVVIIVYVVLPIMALLLGIGLLIAGLISSAGFVAGIFVGIKNFFEVLQEAHKRLP